MNCNKSFQHKKRGPWLQQLANPPAKSHEGFEHNFKRSNTFYSNSKTKQLTLMGDSCKNPFKKLTLQQTPALFATSVRRFIWHNCDNFIKLNKYYRLNLYMICYIHKCFGSILLKLLLSRRDKFAVCVVHLGWLHVVAGKTMLSICTVILVLSNILHC